MKIWDMLKEIHPIEETEKPAAVVTASQTPVLSINENIDAESVKKALDTINEMNNGGSVLMTETVYPSSDRLVVSTPNACNEGLMVPVVNKETGEIFCPSNPVPITTTDEYQPVSSVDASSIIDHILNGTTTNSSPKEEKTATEESPEKEEISKEDENDDVPEAMTSLNDEEAREMMDLMTSIQQKYYPSLSLDPLKSKFFYYNFPREYYIHSKELLDSGKAVYLTPIFWFIGFFLTEPQQFPVWLNETLLLLDSKDIEVIFNAAADYEEEFRRLNDTMLEIDKMI